MQQVVVENRIVEGGLVVGDRTVTLVDIDCPILIAVTERQSDCSTHLCVWPARPFAGDDNESHVCER